MSLPNNTILLTELQLDRIADGLTADGYVLFEDFLTPVLAQALLQEMQSFSELAFKPAAIGRDNLQQLNETVRSNSLHWLDGNTFVQNAYLAIMEQLRIGINRRLFMGLFDFECHYSHYRRGDFYKRHLDAFKGESNRVLSTVLYLNPDWCKKDEGELILYSDKQVSPLLMVEPKFNHCIIFLSDVFPHEVLVTQSDRYSIAGWFRINGSHGIKVDPAA
ncbi:MAG: 2OG-Fe(II) oxygenase [Paraglaciecola sp.]|uniref:2OG-Fe(II) oxygenase n=1 Tax=Pseudomonadati TaxID=3379134 RepID=UPI00273D4F27|nr:2OG-Fe(II) oxygenase [Paraglaciecola sp.]MDP5032355.1 2OG-Fe(II) oxygenase [Paraglaciecola sp.]MDP5133219.1 2OG-Fe(II) oxygenase [Paraglaciecola sp.]